MPQVAPVYYSIGLHLRLEEEVQYLAPASSAGGFIQLTCMYIATCTSTCSCVMYKCTTLVHVHAHVDMSCSCRCTCACGIPTGTAIVIRRVYSKRLTRRNHVLEIETLDFAPIS